MAADILLYQPVLFLLARIRSSMWSSPAMWPAACNHIYGDVFKIPGLTNPQGGPESCRSMRLRQDEQVYAGGAACS